MIYSLFTQLEREHCKHMMELNVEAPRIKASNMQWNIFSHPISKNAKYGFKKNKLESLLPTFGLYKILIG